MVERDVKDYENWLCGLDLLHLEAVREFLSEGNKSILDSDDVVYLEDCKSRYNSLTMKLMLKDIIDVRIDELRGSVERTSPLHSLLYDVTSVDGLKRSRESWDFSWLSALNYVQLGYCYQFLNLVIGRVNTLSTLEVYNNFVDESVKYLLQVVCVKYAKTIGYFNFLHVVSDEVENRFVDDCRLYYGDSKFAGVLEAFKMRAYLVNTLESKNLDLVDFLSTGVKNLVQLDEVGR
jgi:hypothetical protein